jgi:hypothetical protein
MNFSVMFVADLLEVTSIASDDALIVTDSDTLPAERATSSVSSLRGRG